jgi:putative transposase
MKSYQIRLFPTPEQTIQLKKLSDIRKDIWNTLCDMQQQKYNDSKTIFGKFDLNNLLPKLKEQYPNWKKLNSKAIQTISTELYGSYQSFFRLIKKDKTARPPRKIENNDFHSLTFNQSGWMIRDNNIIIINKIPFEYRAHININDMKIKELRIKFRNGKWLCDLIVDEQIQYKDKITVDTRVLALDLGLEKLAHGIDNKGKQIIIHNKSKRINHYFQTQIKNVQSKLSKKTKKSRKHKKLKHTLNSLYQKKNSQIKQTLHIQSKYLANMNYNTIVIGDLTVKKLMSTEGVNSNKRGIRKSFYHSNINMFLQFLGYKCQHNNTNVVTIGEQWTTQLNCLTGKVFKEKIELKDRKVQLSSTITIDRDLNSAINILKRWFDSHIASMNEPLNILSVLEKYNLYKETTTSLVS